MDNKNINGIDDIKLEIQKISSSSDKNFIENFDELGEVINSVNQALNLTDNSQNIGNINSSEIDINDKIVEDSIENDENDDKIEQLKESIEKEVDIIEKNLSIDDQITAESKAYDSSDISDTSDTKENSQENISTVSKEKKETSTKLEKLAGDIFNKNYFSVVEAIIFSSDEPIKPKEIINIIYETDGKNIKINEQDIENIVETLNKKYEDYDLSFRIINVSSGFIFATKEEYANYLSLMDKERSKKRLSQSALETLSIIAYKQPITKAELEKIRGVNSDYIISTLLEKKLITIVGRAESPGRPLLYGTTEEFLIYFGLKSLSDLPKPREVDEIIRDPDFEEQKRKILAVELDEDAVIKDQQQGDDDGSN